MSYSATDFSCSDPTYDLGSEDDEQTTIPSPVVTPHKTTVVGTPAPEKPDEQQGEPDSS